MGNRDNPRRGADFERIAQLDFSQRGVEVTKDYTIDIGVSYLKKPHSFDLGSAHPPILIECKRHSWTKGDNSPSAKLSVWNEAMYYFAAAPKAYRKVLYVLKSSRKGQSLAELYVRRFGNLIPPGVEIWEYDVASRSSSLVYRAGNDAA